MVDEAKENEESDKIKLQIIENRNKIDTLIYQTNKTLAENEDKISEDASTSLREKIDAATEALDSDDLSVLESACRELESELHRVGSEIYSAAESETNKDSEENDDIVDTDFEEVS